MGILLQTIVNGIMLGSIYAMVALGLTLIYGILEIPNFAHGALYMLGARRDMLTFLVSHPLGRAGLAYAVASWLIGMVVMPRIAMVRDA